MREGPRPRFPMRLGSIALQGALLLILPLAGFVVGRKVESVTTPDRGQAAVWMPVSAERVTRSVSFSASVVATPPRPVVARGAGTVTATAVAAGEIVASGTHVLDIDGLAVFASDPSEFLPYRDLARDDAGPDVAALQTFLGKLGYLDGEPTGVFDVLTAAAVSTLFLDSSGRSKDVFPQSSILLVESSGAIEAMTVRAGDLISVGDEVLRVDAGAPATLSDITPPTPAELQVGSAVSLVGRSENDPTAGTIESVDILQVEPGSDNSRRVVITVVDSSGLRDQDQFRASVAIESSADGELSVPVVAVRTDSSGKNFVRARAPGEDTKTVPVTLGVSDGTRVAITRGDLGADSMVEVRTGLLD
jgi:hypothetical protein